MEDAKELGSGGQTPARLFRPASPCFDQLDRPADRIASGVALLKPLKRRMRFRQCREGRHAVVAGDFGVSDDGQYGGRITRARRAESETLRNQLWELLGHAVWSAPPSIGASYGDLRERPRSAAWAPR